MIRRYVAVIVGERVIDRLEPSEWSHENAVSGKFYKMAIALEKSMYTIY